ncbi:chaoptin isoform X1 [Bradysia coprophila]|uniref:chaoptin isoform X1 n=1 Tax=Bradysia coprophila TaxID=38358 RepID=UPI00187D792D|nr:chaoptin isoform X1 [Bradysia coprophila]
MILASLSRASTVRGREIETFKYPPCTFNPLCTCSKPEPDLGIVQCRHVPFPAIPKTINNSKAFMLHMENTGLRSLESYFLQSTGLYKLEISHNLLTEIPDDAFHGLDRTLWELMLQHNELIEIPSRAIRYLQKLTHLDLSGNQISCIEPDSFRGLENSLLILILAKNSINTLPPDSFSSLPLLDTIDLSGNNLEWIDANIFRDGMPKLSKLFLSDNILRGIPYIAIASLKQLRNLDLSHNLIEEILPEEAPEPRAVVKLTLDALHLEYNLIENLYTGSFQRFDIINQTYLDGNPITSLGEEAFRPARITELYIRHCSLQYISPLAFEGLGNSLQILDISANNISSLPENLFDNFDVFRVLNLKDNRLKALNPADAFNGFQYTLLKLDMSGEQNPVTSLQELRRMRNLRSLSLTKLSTKHLSPDDFLEFGLELEDLKITRGPLQTIKSHAFMHVRGLKRLDLSESRLSQIEPDAFNEIGHSLLSLKISHGLTGAALPADAMRHLTSLQELDLSNNQLKTMTDTSFHFMKNLRHLELQDNRIEQVLKGTFQGDIHSKLQTISLSFNHLRQILQHTFVDLENLQQLELDDNRIEHLERRAFMNLDQLRHLNLRGNKLNTIADEAFQNLPELEVLDLAYNKLTNFDFDYFDQVGTLSSLRVNMSHNTIVELADNNTGYGLSRGEHDSNSCHAGSISHSNVKVLDLSHNNISKIYPGFFRPAEISLTHLNLGHNSLMNATRDIFGNMPHLQILDLSHNLIDEIDYNCFRATKSLQLLDVSHNLLRELPQKLFQNVVGIRVVDVSYNFLRFLPENIFAGDGLESLDLSHNLLMKIPAVSFSNLAALSICKLDLSHNSISSIHTLDLSNKFRAMSSLDLSNNQLLRIDDAAFASLPRLADLDLSNNSELKVMDKAFVGLQGSLIKLGLNNVSLTEIPDLPLPLLRVLRVAENELPTVSQELAHNMSSLRVLDLSDNDLTNVPVLMQLLKNLRSLSLAGNSITMLTNESFVGLSETLEHLDVSQLHLNSFELGALKPLDSLRSLKISPCLSIPTFNIPALLEDNDNLRELWIESPGPARSQHETSFDAIANIGRTEPKGPSSTDLRKEMLGNFPLKLRSVTISGKTFTNIAETIFKGIESISLHVTIRNTSLTSIPNFFRHLGQAENISIDLQHNNDKLSKIPNPNTGNLPNLPDAVFLTDLKVASTSLSCDCGVGWIEYWQRKKRQYFCSAQSWSDSIFGPSSRSSWTKKEECNSIDDDLREVDCANKNNQQLLEVLKSEIECGWNGASKNVKIAVSTVIISVVMLLWF